MDLLQKARDIEARLSGTLDRTVGGLVRSGTREPLEIVHEMVESTQKEVQSGGRGRRVFPFNAVTVTILAPSRDARARFEALLASDGSALRDRLLDRLRSAGCSIDAADFEVTVNYDSKPRRNWRTTEFDLTFDRVVKAEKPAAEPQPALPRVEITVLNGSAEKRSYSLAATLRIDIGRCVEVRDNRHRLIRTNHVAFAERSGDVNQTVSRRHAHISCEATSKSFRIHDDGSEHGTGIVRHGRSLPVPRGSRGVRLESGDEIVLGEARVRVKF